MHITMKNYKAKTRGFERSALIVNGRGVPVAEVFTDIEPGDQYETAALLAAAPDLLAALQALLDRDLEHRLHGFPEVAQARAAIAKATGV